MGMTALKPKAIATISFKRGMSIAVELTISQMNSF
jgi:hypothetical protein